jgi:uncharacterized protein (TIGR03083 family)
LDHSVRTRELIQRLIEEGVRLARAAERAGLEAPVPRTDWTVRELVKHVGGIHLWAADVVRAARTELDTEAGSAVGQGPEDDQLLAWYLESHAALVAALTDAPRDLVAATFLPARSPLQFWARRQAHETAVHRADADAACGQIASFPVAFAQDGIAEMLLGFAGRKRVDPDLRGTLSLRCTDGPSWSVSFDSGRLRSEPIAPGTLADVSGTSSDVHLWLWNRESRAQVNRYRPLVQAWQTAVRVSWS